MGIPGHYRANKSVTWMELRGFRNMRLAADGPSDEEEEEEAWEDGQRYPKREWPAAAQRLQRCSLRLSQ